MDQTKQISGLLQMLLNSLSPSTEKAMVSRWNEEINEFAQRRAAREKVISAIGDEYNTYDTFGEIISKTKLPRTTCYKILQRLLTEGVITREKVTIPSRVHSGTYTEYRYSLIKKSK